MLQIVLNAETLCHLRPKPSTRVGCTKSEERRLGILMGLKEIFCGEVLRYFLQPVSNARGLFTFYVTWCKTLFCICIPFSIERPETRQLYYTIISMLGIE